MPRGIVRPCPGEVKPPVFDCLRHCDSSLGRIRQGAGRPSGGSERAIVAWPCPCESPRGCATTSTRHPHRSRVARPSDVSTTHIYTHVLNRGPTGVTSPADCVLGP